MIICNLEVFPGLLVLSGIAGLEYSHWVSNNDSFMSFLEDPRGPTKTNSLRSYEEEEGKKGNDNSGRLCQGCRGKGSKDDPQETVMLNADFS